MYQERVNKTAYIYWRKINDGKRVSHEEASAVGKELLEKALWEVFGLCLKKEKVAAGMNGKPYLPAHPNVQYNISHSGCYVVCAVSGAPVGIDIQEKRIIALDKLGRKVFSADEYREFLKSEEKQDVFFRQWVKIESYLKWTGDGMSSDIRDLPMDGWYQFLHLNKDYICAIWAGEPLDIFMREV